MKEYALNFLIMFIVIAILLTFLAFMGYTLISYLPKPWGVIAFAIFFLSTLCGLSFASDERKANK